MTPTRAAQKQRPCWWCSRKLRLPYFKKVVVERNERVVHKACAQDIERVYVDGEPRRIWEDEP